MSRQRIVVIEDEPDIREVISYNLEREGFAVTSAGDGDAGLDTVRRESPDLVLLDLMLPGLDGLEVCRQLKYDKATRNIPVIMVTAKGEENDVVLGLEVGADDYLPKPFGPRELVARVRAVLRRSQHSGTAEGASKIVMGDLVIDADRFEVHFAGREIRLTATEFRLLHFLAKNPGRVFSRQRLVQEAVGEDVYVLERNIDVHVRAIRKKIGEEHDSIATVRGVGYRFVDDVSG